MCPYSGHILIKLEFSRPIFQKSPNIKYRPCEPSDMIRLLVAFGNVVNTLTKQYYFPKDPVFTLNLLLTVKKAAAPMNH
jgi:hypothetical protein